MNRFTAILSRQFIIVLGFSSITFCSTAQKQIKTYTESFDVGQDAVLDINTSYSDIEFETWNKNKVTVTATFELEGATKEEANTYYESTPIEIFGNSKKVSITSKSQRMGLFPGREFNFDIGAIDIPDVSTFIVDMHEMRRNELLEKREKVVRNRSAVFDSLRIKKDSLRTFLFRTDSIMGGPTVF